MGVSTYSKAKQSLASLLEQAAKEGEARIKGKNGQIFVIKPEPKTESPLDVEGIDLGITTAEIIQFVHQGRKVF